MLIDAPNPHQHARNKRRAIVRILADSECLALGTENHSLMRDHACHPHSMHWNAINIRAAGTIK